MGVGIGAIHEVGPKLNGLGGGVDQISFKIHQHQVFEAKRAREGGQVLVKAGMHLVVGLVEIRLFRLHFFLGILQPGKLGDVVVLQKAGLALLGDESLVHRRGLRLGGQPGQKNLLIEVHQPRFLLL